MLKVCTKCKEEKLISEFSFKRPTNRKPGYQCRCKTCCAKDTKDWNEKNKETARERYLQRQYGISENEFLSRLLHQNNSCLICNKEFSKTWGPNAPVVDHCHTKGHIRGILCNACNRGLGYYHDNPDILRNAANYLEENYHSIHEKRKT